MCGHVGTPARTEVHEVDAYADWLETVSHQVVVRGVGLSENGLISIARDTVVAELEGALPTYSRKRDVPRRQDRHGSRSGSRPALQSRSMIKRDGTLELSLAAIPIPQPKDDEVLARLEASPINPSDLGLLFGAADPTTLRSARSADRPIVTARVPDKLMRGMTRCQLETSAHREVAETHGTTAAFAPVRVFVRN